MKKKRKKKMIMFLFLLFVLCPFDCTIYKLHLQGTVQAHGSYL